jgi:hypothetical protein
MTDTIYTQAARFASKTKAGEIYFQLQKLLYEEKDDCDLSAYRFQIIEGWHVVVIGEKPSDTLHVRIEAFLSHGTLTNLTSARPDVIAYLQGRRLQASQLGPWVEFHYGTPDE